MTASNPNKPLFDSTEAAHIACKVFGKEGTAQKLDGELDYNFHFLDKSGSQYMLKISHEGEQHEVLDFQNQAMRCIADAMGSAACSQAIPSLDSRETVSIKSASGGRHWVRLLTYLPGRFLADTRKHTPRLLENIGRFYGRVDRTLASFTHPAMCRSLIWDLKCTSAGRAFLHQIEAPAQRALATHFLDLFESEALPGLNLLPSSVIHNDGNDYNLRP